MKKCILTWLGIIVALIFGGLLGLSCMSSRPENLGITNGKLAPCPDSPNCVCSCSAKSDQKHFIASLPYSKNEEEVLKQIKAALLSLPRTKIITETENYIHAECTSLLFRFVDDIEILIESDAKQIHFRSASRVGHSDFGVNRKRVENLKQTLQK